MAKKNELTKSVAGEAADFPSLFDPDKIRSIEQIASQCGFSALAKLGQFERADRLLTGIGMLKEMITKEMIAKLRNLENSALGFKTDRDPARNKNCPGPYSDEVIKDCFISSLLHGLYPVNNEWNIISHQMYITLNGFRRLVTEWPDVANVVVTTGVYQFSADKTCAFVPVACSWTLEGTPCELLLVQSKSADGTVVSDDRIICKADSYLGPDGIFGKAKRKAYARIFEVLSSQSVADGDVAELDQARRITGPKDLPQKSRTLLDVAEKFDENDARLTVQEATSNDAG